MKAARVHRFGPPDAVVIDEIDIPQPDEHEVLVQVNAAGVGPWDGLIRSGKSVLPRPLPLTLGADLSGIVTAVGSGVTALARPWCGRHLAPVLAHVDLRRIGSTRGLAKSITISGLTRE